MALLTTQSPANTGTALSYAAAAASDTITGEKGLVLIAKNTNGATRDLVITVPGNDSFGTARPDVTVALPATTGEKFILLSPHTELMASNGLITITPSATAGVTYAVIRT